MARNDASSNWVLPASVFCSSATMTSNWIPSLKTFHLSKAARLQSYSRFLQLSKAYGQSEPALSILVVGFCMEFVSSC
jgi:hypothetical protein